MADDEIDLLELHARTLNTFTPSGDLDQTNEPYPPCRRRANAVRFAWTSSDLRVWYRDDIDPAVRAEVDAWVRDTSPTDVLGALDALAAACLTSADRFVWGPAYTLDHPVDAGDATFIDADNAHLLPADFLTPGELPHIQPATMVVRDGKSVSVCHTVRRTELSKEAGVDTLEPYRGQGFAVEATRAWVNATIEEGYIPFYSTSSDNTASQRVAQKVGFRQFATEMGLRG